MDTKNHQSEVSLDSPILLIDPDEDFLQQLKSEEPSLKELQTAKTLREAQAAMIHPSSRFSGIFVNPKISHPAGLSMFRFAHLNHVGTPLFYLHDQQTKPLPQEELERIAVQESVEKPVSLKDLVSMITPLVTDFEVEESIEPQEGRSDLLDKEGSVGSEGYIPIRVNSFLSGRKSFFDVFIRLRSNRYLKVVQSGDPFSPERLEKYIRKGVAYFYIKREMQDRYISYCDHLSNALTSVLSDASAQIAENGVNTSGATQKSAVGQVATSQTLALGHELMRLFQEKGIQSEYLGYTGNFIQNLGKLTKKGSFSDRKELSSFLNQAAAYEHGVSTAFISSLIAQKLELRTERIQKILGFASLFHDIGLVGAPQTLIEKMGPEFDLSEKDFGDSPEYIDHPKLSAEILKKSEIMDPVVIQTVLQHHETRDQKGFPSRLGAGHIGLLSEIVGLSDQFSVLLSRSKKDQQINPFVKVKEKILNRYSLAVLEAFESLFLR